MNKTLYLAWAELLKAKAKEETCVVDEAFHEMMILYAIDEVVEPWLGESLLISAFDLERDEEPTFLLLAAAWEDACVAWEHIERTSSLAAGSDGEL